MNIWIVREHRGDSYRLFLQKEPPLQKEDRHWYHVCGMRGLEIPKLLWPETFFPKIAYDEPIKIELIIKKQNEENC